MQTKNLLLDWGYPVVDHGLKLRSNCRVILDVLDHAVQFVGIGASGAMILGALSVQLCIHPHQFILIGENRIKPHQKIIFHDLPIVVVDDHYCSGKTIHRIGAYLKSHHVDHLVEYVIMNEWKQCDLMETSKQTMEVVFPSATWIH